MIPTDDLTIEMSHVSEKNENTENSDAFILDKLEMNSSLASFASDNNNRDLNGFATMRITKPKSFQLPDISSNNNNNNKNSNELNIFQVAETLSNNSNNHNNNNHTNEAHQINTEILANLEFETTSSNNNEFYSTTNGDQANSELNNDETIADYNEFCYHQESGSYTNSYLISFVTLR